MSDNRNIVTYEEQQEMGLVKRSGGNFIAPLRGEVLPPVRSVPTVVDPYASSLPQTIQQETQYISNPITRAQAMVTKVHQVTLFLSILTGAAMLLFDMWFFLGWVILASVEWVSVFVFLSILDYREQPAAQHRHEMDAYLGMMEREQSHRLRHLYPDQYDKRGRRK
jgi:hypothetical protein